MARTLGIALLLATLAPVNIIGKMRIDFTILFTWGVLLAFAVFIASKINLWVGLFFILTSLLSFIDFDDVNVQTKYFFILGGMIWYFLCVEYMSEKIMLRVICLIGLANVTYLILQHFSIDPFHRALKPDIAHRFDDIGGAMSCPNEASAILAFCFMAFCKAKTKIRVPLIAFDRGGFKYFKIPVIRLVGIDLTGLWVIPLMIIGLIIAKSFGGPLALASGLVFLGIMKCSKYSTGTLLLPILAAAILSLYWYFVDTPGTLGRLSAWQVGIGLYPQHWLLGYGLGYWKIVFAKPEIVKDTLGMYYNYAHMDQLQMLFELGIGFAVVVAGYFVNIYRRYGSRALIPMSAIVVIFVNSLVFFPFHIAPTAMVALTWMALLEVSLRKKECLNTQCQNG